MKIIETCATGEYVVRCEQCNTIQTVKRDIVDRVVFCRQCHADAETISQLEKKLDGERNENQMQGDA